jgi:NAD(P)-dependent dehydrogenase (short-subunit alcohol dehydrogenase family)
MDLLNGKIIVVTGGCGLLGQEFIKGIVNSKGIAIITDIEEEKGESIVKKIRDQLESDNVLFRKLDITSLESVKTAIGFFKDKFGKIDALVNNAYPRNMNYGNNFEKVRFEDFTENINCHLGGYFLISQQFAEFFKSQKFGNIISISSIYGVVPPRFEIYDNTTMTMPVEYALIKAAIIHLSKYMAKYYKGTGIRFNCLSPGGILNNQDQLFVDKYNSFALSKGMLDKNDIIGALVFLLSDMSKYVNGQNIVVDDGWSL